MPRFWQRLLKLFGRSRSRFELGDSVQLRSGSGKHLMIVIEVMASGKMDEPLVHCQWYEPETRETRKNIFRQSDLMPFDWMAASKKHERRALGVEKNVRDDEPKP